MELRKIKGLVYGISYGLIAWALFRLESKWDMLNTSGLMTTSFLFLVPFVVGLITAYYHREVVKVKKIVALSMPLYAILGLTLITLLAGLEGIICVLMALPVFALLALIGGFIGLKLFDRQPNKLTVSLLLLLPFIVAPVEDYLGLSTEIFIEETTIEIQASKTDIWKHITRVEMISEDENRVSLFQGLGFPRPLEATLDTVAVGGVRIARFDRGLFFKETVTEMIPYQKLAFSIEADPEAIPPTALDEHVLVGGNYFDVLHGQYELEQVGQDKYILHLSSRFRLSTNFNFYSGLWSKLIMRDIQNNILNIVKERAEGE